MIGQRYSLRMAQAGMRITYADSSGVEDAGGQMFLNDNEGAVGFFGDGTDAENFMYFQSDGRTVHIGRWDANFASTFRD